MRNRIIFIIIVLSIRILPYIISNDIFTHIADNLDEKVPNRMVLKYTKTFFEVSNSQTLDLIGNNDFQRNWYPSGFGITSLMFYWFSPLTAFKANYIISILIGFFGIFLLIPKISRDISFAIQLLISVSFTFLPWVHMFECGYIAALPILIYGILNIFKKQNLLLSYLILFLYPFFSSFPLIIFFVFLYYGVILLLLLAFSKFSEFKKLLIGLILLIVSTILANLNLFNLMLFDHDFINHRSIRVSPDFDISQRIKSMINIFKHGRVHAVSNHEYIILFIFIAVVIYLAQRFLKKEQSVLLPFILIIFWVFNTILSEFANFFIKIPFISGFDYSRFSMLNPTIVYAIFILFLDSIFRYKRPFYNLVGILFVLLNLFQIVRINKEYLLNVECSFRKVEFVESEFEKHKCLSFNSFYDEALFSSCKKIINEAEDKPICVALGIYPGVLNFNDIHTLDHYTNIYDLNYKLRFRKIIEGEIKKSDYIRNKFDDYGSRCFLFSSEMREFWHENQGEILTKFESPKHIKNLDINTAELSKMNCNFIISSVVIDNSMMLNLELLNSITNSESIYNLYIYHIKTNIKPQ